MTIDEAITELRAAGLVAQAYQGGDRLSVAGDRREADEAERRQGVSVVYRFGFTLARVEGGWRLRGANAGVDEELPGLKEAVTRGLEMYRAHRG